MKTLRIRLFISVLISATFCYRCQEFSPTDTRTARLIYPPARRDSTVDVYRGSDKPISEVLDEQIDISTFVLKTLNISYGNTRETHPEK